MKKRKLINFIKGFRIEKTEEKLQQYVKMCFLDTIMVLSAGTRNQSSGKAATFAKKYFSGADATILRTGERVGLMGAALANAMAANALDMDDGFNLTKGHPGAGIIGGIISASEMLECSYGDFLSALLVGYEISMRQGLCVQNYYNFYHSTGAYIGVGIAAAINKLWNTTDEELVNSIGIADYYGPLVPCMRTVREPSMNKDGIYLGTQIGVEAVLLARSGFDGKAPLLLDDRYKDHIRTLGEKYYIYDLYFKFFSCCRWAQSALTALEDIMTKNVIDLNKIEKIEVYSYGASGELYSGIPSNETEAQYNLRYPIASYLLNGDFGPMQSSIKIDQSNAIRELMDKIIFIPCKEFEDAFPQKRYSKVVIWMTGGKNISSNIVEPKGEPGAKDNYIKIVEKGVNINKTFSDVDKLRNVINIILKSDYGIPFNDVLNAILSISIV